MATRGAIQGLTIEIGGDTTKLADSLKSVDKSLKQTQSNLKDIDKLLKKDPGNTKLLVQKQKELTKAIDGTKDRLDKLKKAQKDATDPEVYDALQREIIETEQNLESLEEEYRNFGSVGSQKMQAVGGKISETGEKITKVGTTLTTHLTAPIAGVAVAANAAFNDVDEGIDTIILKTGAGGDALDEMTQSMKDIATSIPTDFATAGEAIGEVNTRFGVTGEKLEELSTQYIKFATINGTDVTGAVDATQKALAAFGLTADDASGYLDTLTAVSQATGADVNTLAANVVSNSTAFKEMGLSIDDATVMMGQLEMSGADSNAVLSGLSKALKNAAADGKPLDTALKELQVSILTGTESTDGLTAAYDLFGKSGAQVYEAVQSGALDFISLAGAAEDASGTVTDTFEATLDPADQFNVALNSLKVLGADIAEVVMPLLSDVLEKVREVVTNLTEKWNSLDDGQKETILTIAGVVAAIGPVVTAIGGVTTTVGKLVTGVGKILPAISGFLPSGWVMVAIAAAAALVIANWDDIKKFVEEKLLPKLKEAWEGIQKTVGDVVAALKKFWEETLKPAWEALKTYVVDTLWPKVKEAWESIKATVDTVVKALKDYWESTLKPAWEALKTYVVDTLWPKVKEAWESIKATVDTVVKALKDYWESTLKPAWEALKTFVVDTLWPKLKEAWENIQTKVDTVVKALKGFWETTLKPAWEALKTFVVDTLWPKLKEAWENIQTKVDTVVKALKGFWETTLKPVWDGLVEFVSETLGPTLTNTWEAIKTTVDTCLKAIKKLWNNTVKPIYDGIIDFFTGVFSGDWEKAWEGIQKIVDGVWNAIQTAAELVWENAKTWGKTIIDNFSLAFTDAWDTVKDSIIGKWDAIKDKAAELWTAATDWAKNIIDNFSSSITTAWEDVKETIVGLFDAIPDAFKTIVDNALNWGKDMIQNFKDGITEKWDSLKEKVSDIGQGIKNFLGFSVPEEGPLSDFDTYAPDMMDLFISGIQGKMGELTQSVYNVGQRLADMFGTIGENSFNRFVAGYDGKRGGQMAKAIKGPMNDGYGEVKVLKWKDLGEHAYAQIKQGYDGYWGNQMTNAIKNPVQAAFDSIWNMGWWDIGYRIYEGISAYGGWIKDSFDFSRIYVKTPHWWVDRWHEISGTYYPEMSVHWYKKAYDNPVMFTSPTVLATAGGLKGFGDGAGGEVVLSADKLRELVGNGGDTIFNIYAQPGQDARQIAEEVQRIMAREQQQRSVAYA